MYGNKNHNETYLSMHKYIQLLYTFNKFYIRYRLSSALLDSEMPFLITLVFTLPFRPIRMLEFECFFISTDNTTVLIKDQKRFGVNLM
jgi:hypothetical protein